MMPHFHLKETLRILVRNGGFGRVFQLSLACIKVMEIVMKSIHYKDTPCSGKLAFHRETT